MSNQHGNPLGNYPIPTVLFPDPKMPFARILEQTLGKAEAMAYLASESTDAPPFLMFNVQALKTEEYGARMAIARLRTDAPATIAQTAEVIWVGPMPHVFDDPGCMIAFAKMFRHEIVSADVEVGDVVDYQDLSRVVDAIADIGQAFQAVQTPLSAFVEAAQGLRGALRSARKK